MIATLKRYLQKIALAANRSRWKDDRSVKVLIRVNRGFPESEWRGKLAGFTDSVPHKIEIQYAGSKTSFLKLFPEADVCFAFGLNSSMNLDTHKPLMIYLATVGAGAGIRHEKHAIHIPAGISSPAIAEYVLGMMVMLTRQIDKAIGNQADKMWKQQEFLSKPYKPLKDHVVGVIGLGKVGSKVAEVCRLQGCKVLGCDLEEETAVHVDGFFPADRLDDMLKASDIVVLCAPPIPENRNLINRTRLEMIGPAGYLINVSRAEMVDTAALKETLSHKMLAGAATDVAPREPLPAGNGYWRIPRLVITPHIAGNINFFSAEIMNDFMVKTSEYLKNRG